MKIIKLIKIFVFLGSVFTGLAAGGLLLVFLFKAAAPAKGDTSPVQEYRSSSSSRPIFREGNAETVEVDWREGNSRHPSISLNQVTVFNPVND